MGRRAVRFAAGVGVAIAQIIFLAYALSKMLELLWQNLKARSEHENEREQAYGKRRG